MSITRRSFLKILGGTAAAAVAAPLIVPQTAPLFVPSDRLDYGVPRAILTATELPTTPTSHLTWTNTFLKAAETGVIAPIPMLLAHDEFRPPGWRQFGRDRVPAGTTLLVDRTTAERWIEHGVGTPGPAAPTELQEASMRRWAARRLREPEGYDPDEPRFVATGPYGGSWVARREPLEVMRARQSERDRLFQQRLHLDEASYLASLGLEGAAASAWWDSIPEGPVLVDTNVLATRCFPSDEDTDDV